MLKEFKNQVAVVTGAGSGFGREFAMTAARRGMKLVLADIQADALARTAATLNDMGVEFKTQVTDVGDFDQVEALRDTCLSAYGVPQLLFNNAGVAKGGLLWEHGIADWEWVLRVNLWGVIHGVRAFVPAMVDADKPAHVVNTASVAGLLSAPSLGIYNVSKHGVVTLSETLFHDLRMVKSAVGVSVLCPAFVPTGIDQSERNRPEALASKEAETQSMKQAQALTSKAVKAGRITAPEVAQTTFTAIEEDQFYIITHDKIMDSVKLRLDDVAGRTNPTDPYSLKRDVAPKAGSGKESG
ncbi:MAG: SDR family oxidoreductase [Burkholderiaceae bacterium]